MPVFADESPATQTQVVYRLHVKLNLEELWHLSDVYLRELGRKLPVIILPSERCKLAELRTLSQQLSFCILTQVQADFIGMFLKPRSSKRIPKLSLST